LASRKACPRLRNVSLKRQISTRCWLRKCSSSNSLPHTPSAFRQVRCGALHRSVLLGRAAIFGQKQNNGLQDSPRAGCPRGQVGGGHEEPPSQLHTFLERKAIEEIRDFLKWGGGNLCWEHQVGGCGFDSRRFDARGCFLFRLLSSCCGLGLRLLRPGRLPGGGHFRLLGSLRERLRRWIWTRGWSGGGGVDDMPPSNDVVPHIAQVHLLG